MFYSTCAATSDSWKHCKAGAVRINGSWFTLHCVFFFPVFLYDACLCVFCQAHCIMSVTGEQRLFITESGRLCGVITWKEVIRAVCTRTNLYTHKQPYTNQILMNTLLTLTICMFRMFFWHQIFLPDEENNRRDGEGSLMHGQLAQTSESHTQNRHQFVFPILIISSSVGDFTQIIMWVIIHSEILKKSFEMKQPFSRVQQGWSSSNVQYFMYSNFYNRNSKTTSRTLCWTLFMVNLYKRVDFRSHRSTLNVVLNIFKM